MQRLRRFTNFFSYSFGRYTKIFVRDPLTFQINVTQLGSAIDRGGKL